VIGFGTILNAAGILLGGILGLTLSRQLSHGRQVAIKGLLGVFTVYVGLKMTWTSLGGGVGAVARQLAIVLLALMLGRITGRLLHLQKFLNRLGQYAKAMLTKTSPDTSARFGEGFITCSLLFCVGPMAILGAIQDGLSGQWQTLGIKGLMDGLATMAFVATFGWGAIMSVIPVVAYEGTITLCARLLEPFLRDRALLDSVNATGGLLVFCVALIILELRRIELADYLPSLLFAPLLAWLWR
jgi:uncharacterized membrane protein YqgA involved in biofilm formation